MTEIDLEDMPLLRKCIKAMKHDGNRDKWLWETLHLIREGKGVQDAILHASKKYNARLEITTIQHLRKFNERSDQQRLPHAAAHDAREE